MIRSFVISVGIIGILFTGVLFADKIPDGYVVLQCTVSPDNRYGVLVPKLEDIERLEMTTGAQNQVIELATGRVIAVIRTDQVGATRHGHGGVLPSRWTSNDSLLLWQVDGKWFRDAVILLKFTNGKLEWQSDIMRAAVAECLLRTRRAEPRLYARAMARNVRNGRAYPDGFSVQVLVADKLELPLNVRATLTSNPKGLEDFPFLESSLVGFVDSEGRFQVCDFEVGKGLWKKYLEDVAEPEDAVCKSTETYVPPKGK